MRTQNIFLSATRCPVGAFSLLTVVALSISLSRENAVAADKADIQLVTSVINATNEYQLNWVKGSQAFAESVGLPLKVVNSNGDSSQEISQIQAILAAGKKVVLTVNPVASADVPAIVKAVCASGGYVVTQWNKPAEFQVKGQGDCYVAHIGFDGYAAGEYTASKLFEAMGGSGGVIALQGVLDSTAQQQRWVGFQRALKNYPGIKLLGEQAANWDQQQGYKAARTLEAQFGDQLKGVWGASDSMTLGAVSAMKAAGRDDVKFAGIDGVSQAIDMIKNGNSYVATWAADPWYSGAIGLAIGYAAATGKLDVAQMTDDQRDGTYRQVGVDKSNVGEYATPPNAQKIMTEVNKGPFDRQIGPALR